MRSPRVSRTRPCTLRRSTTRCYLSAAFSASSRFFDLKSAARRISPIIAASLRRFSHWFNADEVFGTHSRSGMHRYNNQDHSMLAAMEAVDNIAQGIDDKSNIWRINSEEVYGEERPGHYEASRVNFSCPVTRNLDQIVSHDSGTYGADHFQALEFGECLNRTTQKMQCCQDCYSNDPEA
jgi:hypothetical protein